MDQDEQEAIGRILQDAQGIVEGALGASLGGSVVRDQLLVSLSGFLLQDYWDRKSRVGRPSRDEMLAETVSGIARDLLGRWQEDTHSGRINPQDTAMALTKEMAAQWPGRDREWWADTFDYFLDRARAAMRSQPPGG